MAALPTISLTELLGEFVLAKSRAGRSADYVRRVPVTLKTFSHGRARRPVSSITPQEIEAWLADSPWAPRTRRGYLLNLRTMFNFGIRRGYLLKIPALAVDLPSKDHKPPGIHSPARVRTVLGA